MKETIQVIQSSSVDISQHTVVAEFESREDAEAYIREHAVDKHGNVSHEDGCDYLRIGGDDD